MRPVLGWWRGPSVRRRLLPRGRGRAPWEAPQGGTQGSTGEGGGEGPGEGEAGWHQQKRPTRRGTANMSPLWPAFVPISDMMGSRLVVTWRQPALQLPLSAASWTACPWVKGQCLGQPDPKWHPASLPHPPSPSGPVSSRVCLQGSWETGPGDRSAALREFKVVAFLLPRVEMTPDHPCCWDPGSKLRALCECLVASCH